jgi:hypothetical protein
LRVTSRGLGDVYKRQYRHCLKINQKIKTYDNLSGIENTLKTTWKIAIFLEICVTNKKI